jgi:hypothetical protein
MGGSARSHKRGCRQTDCIRFAIRPQVLRPRESALQKPVITGARRSAMFGKLFIMKREDNILAQPDPFRHFASSRRALR